MEEREPPDQERRRYPRFPLSYPIAFSGDLLEGEGNVVNISKLGCAVQSDQQVEEGAYLNLFFRLPERPVPMKIELAVVRGARGGLFGTEFIHIHPTAQERLLELIKFLKMLRIEEWKIKAVKDLQSLVGTEYAEPIDDLLNYLVSDISRLD